MKRKKASHGYETRPNGIHRDVNTAQPRAAKPIASAWMGPGDPTNGDDYRIAHHGSLSLSLSLPRVLYLLHRYSPYES